MEGAKFILIYGGSLCLIASIAGGLFELGLWMRKGWLGLRDPNGVELDRASVAATPDAWIKALAELLKAVATAPPWLALFGVGYAMLYSVEAIFKA